MRKKRRLNSHKFLNGRNMNGTEQRNWIYEEENVIKLVATHNFQHVLMVVPSLEQAAERRMQLLQEDGNRFIVSTIHPLTQEDWNWILQTRSSNWYVSPHALFCLKADSSLLAFSCQEIAPTNNGDIIKTRQRFQRNLNHCLREEIILAQKAAVVDPKQHFNAAWNERIAYKENKQNISDLQVEIRQLKEKYEERRKEVQAQLEQANQVAQSHKSKSKDRKSQLAEVKKKLSDKKQEVEELMKGTKNISSWENKIKAMKERHTEKRSQLQKKIEELQEKLQQVEKQRNDVETNYNSRIEMFKKQIEEITSHLVGVMEQNKQMQREMRGQARKKRKRLKSIDNIEKTAPNTNGHPPYTNVSTSTSAIATIPAEPIAIAATAPAKPIAVEATPPARIIVSLPTIAQPMVVSPAVGKSIAAPSNTASMTTPSTSIAPENSSSVPMVRVKLEPGIQAAERNIRPETAPTPRLEQADAQNRIQADAQNRAQVDAPNRVRVATSATVPNRIPTKNVATSSTIPDVQSVQVAFMKKKGTTPLVENNNKTIPSPQESSSCTPSKHPSIIIEDRSSVPPSKVRKVEKDRFALQPSSDMEQVALSSSKETRIESSQRENRALTKDSSLKSSSHSNLRRKSLEESGLQVFKQQSKPVAQQTSSPEQPNPRHPPATLALSPQTTLQPQPHTRLQSQSQHSIDVIQQQQPQLQLQQQQYTDVQQHSNLPTQQPPSFYQTQSQPNSKQYSVVPAQNKTVQTLEPSGKHGYGSRVPSLPVEPPPPVGIASSQAVRPPLDNRKRERETEGGVFTSVIGDMRADPRRRGGAELQNTNIEPSSSSQGSNISNTKYDSGAKPFPYPPPPSYNKAAPLQVPSVTPFPPGRPPPPPLPPPPPSGPLPSSTTDVLMEQLVKTAKQGGVHETSRQSLIDNEKLLRVDALIEKLQAKTNQAVPKVNQAIKSRELQNIQDQANQKIYQGPKEKSPNKQVAEARVDTQKELESESQKNRLRKSLETKLVPEPRLDVNKKQHKLESQKDRPIASREDHRKKQVRESPDNTQKKQPEAESQKDRWIEPPEEKQATEPRIESLKKSLELVAESQKKQPEAESQKDRLIEPPEKKQATEPRIESLKKSLELVAESQKKQPEAESQKDRLIEPPEKKQATEPRIESPKKPLELVAESQKKQPEAESQKDRLIEPQEEKQATEPRVESPKKPLEPVAESQKKQPEAESQKDRLIEPPEEKQATEPRVESPKKPLEPVAESQKKQPEAESQKDRLIEPPEEKQATEPRVESPKKPLEPVAESQKKQPEAESQKKQPEAESQKDRLIEPQEEKQARELVADSQKKQLETESQNHRLIKSQEEKQAIQHRVEISNKSLAVESPPEKQIPETIAETHENQIENQQGQSTTESQEKRQKSESRIETNTSQPIETTKKKQVQHIADTLKEPEAHQLVVKVSGEVPETVVSVIPTKLRETDIENAETPAENSLPEDDNKRFALDLLKNLPPSTELWKIIKETSEAHAKEISIRASHGSNKNQNQPITDPSVLHEQTLKNKLGLLQPKGGAVAIKGKVLSKPKLEKKIVIKAPIAIEPKTKDTSLIQQPSLNAVAKLKPIDRENEIADLIISSLANTLMGEEYSVGVPNNEDISVSLKEDRVVVRRSMEPINRVTQESRPPLIAEEALILVEAIGESLENVPRAEYKPWCDVEKEVLIKLSQTKYASLLEICNYEFGNLFEFARTRPEFETSRYPPPDSIRISLIGRQYLENSKKLRYEQNLKVVVANDETAPTIPIPVVKRRVEQGTNPGSLIVTVQKISKENERPDERYVKISDYEAANHEDFMEIGDNYRYDDDDDDDDDEDYYENPKNEPEKLDMYGLPLYSQPRLPPVSLMQNSMHRNKSSRIAPRSSSIKQQQKMRMRTAPAGSSSNIGMQRCGIETLPALKSDRRDALATFVGPSLASLERFRLDKTKEPSRLSPLRDLHSIITGVSADSQDLYRTTDRPKLLPITIPPAASLKSKSYSKSAATDEPGPRSGISAAKERTGDSTTRVSNLRGSPSTPRNRDRDRDRSRDYDQPSSLKTVFVAVSDNKEDLRKETNVDNQRKESAKASSAPPKKWDATAEDMKDKKTSSYSPSDRGAKSQVPRTPEEKKIATMAVHSAKSVDKRVGHGPVSSDTLERSEKIGPSAPSNKTSVAPPSSGPHTSSKDPSVNSNLVVSPKTNSGTTTLPPKDTAHTYSPKRNAPSFSLHAAAEKSESHRQSPSSSKSASGSSKISGNVASRDSVASPVTFPRGIPSGIKSSQAGSTSKHVAPAPSTSLSQFSLPFLSAGKPSLAPAQKAVVPSIPPLKKPSENSSQSPLATALAAASGNPDSAAASLLGPVSSSNNESEQNFGEKSGTAQRRVPVFSLANELQQLPSRSLADIQLEVPSFHSPSGVSRSKIQTKLTGPSSHSNNDDNSYMFPQHFTDHKKDGREYKDDGKPYEKRGYERESRPQLNSRRSAHEEERHTSQNIGIFPSSRSNFKKIPCLHFQSTGRCAKGDACPYLH